ncbi:hypothetical protein FOA52_003679 [Chlamydomonas sp. UWO 241]|nr:hypothetical protein FOA52_003679 [Chlamydomonas sp. UWO 241]
MPPCHRRTTAGNSPLSAPTTAGTAPLGPSALSHQAPADTGRARPAWGAGAVRVSTLIKSLSMPRVREGSMSGAVTPLTPSAAKAESARLRVSGGGPAAAANVVDLPSTELSQHLSQHLSQQSSLMHGHTAWGGDIDAHAAGCAMPVADSPVAPSPAQSRLQSDEPEDIDPVLRPNSRRPSAWGGPLDALGSGGGGGGGEGGCDMAPMHVRADAAAAAEGWQNGQPMMMMTGGFPGPLLPQPAFYGGLPQRAFHGSLPQPRIHGNPPPQAYASMAGGAGLSTGYYGGGEVHNPVAARPGAGFPTAPPPEPNNPHVEEEDAEKKRRRCCGLAVTPCCLTILVLVLLTIAAAAVVPAVLLTQGSSDTGADSALYAIEGAGLLGTGMQSLSYETSLSGVDPNLALNNPDDFKQLLREQLAVIFGIDPSTIVIDEVVIDPTSATPIVVTGSFVADQTGAIDALARNIQAMQADAGVWIEDRGSAGLLARVLIPSDAIRVVASKLSAMYAIKGAGLLGSGLLQLEFSTEITGVDPVLAASNEDAFRSLVATEQARVFNIVVSQVRIDSVLVSSGSRRRALADSSVIIKGAFLPDGSGTVDALVRSIHAMPANPDVKILKIDSDLLHVDMALALPSVQAALMNHVKGWGQLSTGMATLVFTSVVDGVDKALASEFPAMYKEIVANAIVAIISGSVGGSNASTGQV